MIDRYSFEIYVDLCVIKMNSVLYYMVHKYGTIENGVNYVQVLNDLK